MPKKYKKVSKKKVEKPKRTRKGVAESRTHVAGEIETRLLLILGASPADASRITGFDEHLASELELSINSFGSGPYSADAAARMMGMGYRTIYHLLGEKEIKAVKEHVGSAVRYSITRDQLIAFVKRRLGVDAERKVRYLLFDGAGVRLATMRAAGKLSVARIEKILAELEKAHVGPGDTGPFTVRQASLLLMVKPRLVCRFCEEGRLFADVDSELRDGYGLQKRYVISRQTLAAFARRDRKRGKPGQVQRALEKKDQRRKKQEFSESKAAAS